jgi:hypothetical protein
VSVKPLKGGAGTFLDEQKPTPGHLPPISLTKTSEFSALAARAWLYDAVARKEVTMRRRAVLLPLFLMICLGVVSCSSAKEEAPPPDMTIQDIMKDVIDPSAEYMWKAIGVEVSEKGTIERQPKTDEEWKEHQRHAKTLVDAGDLLVVPGRKAAAPGVKSEFPGIELEPVEIDALLQKEWPQFERLAKEFQRVAAEQLKASEARDIEGLYKAGGDLDTTCENCHKVFYYPNDPIYKDEKK